MTIRAWAAKMVCRQLSLMFWCFHSPISYWVTLKKVQSTLIGFSSGPTSLRVPKVTTSITYHASVQLVPWALILTRSFPSCSPIQKEVCSLWPMGRQHGTLLRSHNPSPMAYMHAYICPLVTLSRPLNFSALPSAHLDKEKMVMCVCFTALVWGVKK